VFKGESKVFEEEGLADFIKCIKYTDNAPIMTMMDAVKLP
jgi:hypothetical protein